MIRPLLLLAVLAVELCLLGALWRWVRGRHRSGLYVQLATGGLLQGAAGVLSGLVYAWLYHSLSSAELLELAQGAAILFGAVGALLVFVATGLSSAFPPPGAWGWTADDEPALGITVEATDDEPAECPLCLAVCGASEPLTACPRCGTRYHTACVEELGRRCASLGCGALLRA